MQDINKFGCNNATNKNYKKSPGNFIPSSWYQNIINGNKSADLPAITLLAEIVYWYRPNKDGQSKLYRGTFETSYRKLEKKFKCGKQTLRRAFTRLEGLGLVRRELKTLIRGGMKHNNVLCIILENDNLITNPDDIGFINDKKISTPHYKMDPASLQDDGDMKDKKKDNSNNRSINLESNFSNPSKKKKLKDFYPINEVDCKILQSKSGRNFNLNAMNEILLSMSKRLCDREFLSKGAFLNYMSKALESEKRQSEQINNPTFRIKSNLTKDEITKREMEQYLEKVETSRDISDSSRLKKKLAGCFDNFRAYAIIKNLQNIAQRQDGKVQLIFHQNLSLSYADKEVISTQALSVFNKAGSLNIRDIEIIFLDTEPKPKINSNNLQATPIPDNVWGRVREKLRETYGDGVDISWFSVLNPKIDHPTKTLSLIAPNGFMSDWIDTHYKGKIIDLAQNYGFELGSISHVQNQSNHNADISGDI